MAGIGVYFGEYLLDNIHKMDLLVLGIYIVSGYVAAIVFFSLLTYIQYSVKYHLAKKSVKRYYENLTRLEKIYSREEKKTAGRKAAGGNKR